MVMPIRRSPVAAHSSGLRAWRGFVIMYFLPLPSPHFFLSFMLHCPRVTDTRLVSDLSATVRYPDPFYGFKTSPVPRLGGSQTYSPNNDKGRENRAQKKVLYKW